MRVEEFYYAQIPSHGTGYSEIGTPKLIALGEKDRKEPPPDEGKERPPPRGAAAGG